MSKRTQEEIIARIESVKKDDWMGTQVNDLICFLDYEHAKQFLKEGVSEKEWSKLRSETKPPAEQIQDYMEFAWDKANNFRGISASRSIEHMVTWLWLDGQDEFLKENDLLDYEYYGKPQLVSICELYGIDSTKYDDGVRKNDEY